MAPFIPIPGEPPRKVLIDRLQKLYESLSIEELLTEWKIDYRHPQDSPASWLPLEAYDDQTFECRIPDSWIQLGAEQDELGTGFLPIAGKVHSPLITHISLSYLNSQPLYIYIYIHVYIGT